MVVVLLPFLTVQYSSTRLPNTGADVEVTSHVCLNPGTTCLIAFTTSILHASLSLFGMTLLLLLSVSWYRLIIYDLTKHSKRGPNEWSNDVLSKSDSYKAEKARIESQIKMV